MAELLKVENLRVSYHTYQGEVQSVRGVSFHINEGETVALVGESGCGKSVTAKTVMHLIAPNAEVKEGSEILFEGEDVLHMKGRDLREYCGGKCSIIFQDALASLNPTMKVGRQIAEMLRHHRKISKQEAAAEAVNILRAVGISDPENRANQYPHNFSGGQRQRIMIGIALACNPRLLIADEPTTALDVTVQDQIITLLRERQEQNGTSILIITHDLGVVANIAQRIYVMYAGRIVEEGTSREIFYNPQHPYTWALLKAVPRLDATIKSDLESIEGTPPDLLAPPVGCPFAPRCKYCMEICKTSAPTTTTFEPGHCTACWLHHKDAPQVERPVFTPGGVHKDTLQETTFWEPNAEDMTSPTITDGSGI